MSYDITFKVKLEGIDQYVPIGDCDANITWNVRDIIKLSTGLPWLNGENKPKVKKRQIYCDIYCQKKAQYAARQKK